MEEPIDNLTTQSATDNTATTSTPQAERRSLNEEGSKSESAASVKTAVNFAQDMRIGTLV